VTFDGAHYSCRRLNWDLLFSTSIEESRMKIRITLAIVCCVVLFASAQSPVTHKIIKFER
jgi:hypothetical protein